MSGKSFSEVTAKFEKKLVGVWGGGSFIHDSDRYSQLLISTLFLHFGGNCSCLLPFYLQNFPTIALDPGNTNLEPLLYLNLSASSYEDNFSSLSCSPLAFSESVRTVYICQDCSITVRALNLAFHCGYTQESLM